MVVWSTIFYLHNLYISILILKLTCNIGLPATEVSLLMEERHHRILVLCHLSRYCCQGCLCSHPNLLVKVNIELHYNGKVIKITDEGFAIMCVSFRGGYLVLVFSSYCVLLLLQSQVIPARFSYPGSQGAMCVCVPYSHNYRFNLDPQHLHWLPQWRIPLTR